MIISPRNLHLSESIKNNYNTISVFRENGFFKNLLRKDDNKENTIYFYFSCQILIKFMRMEEMNFDSLNIKILNIL